MKKVQGGVSPCRLTCVALARDDQFQLLDYFERISLLHILRGHGTLYGVYFLLATFCWQRLIGPGHIRSFYLLLFPNKAVFLCISYGKPKST